MPRKISVTALENKLRSVQDKIRKLQPKHNELDFSVRYAQQEYDDDHTDAAHRKLISALNKQHALHKKMNALEIEEDNLVTILRSLQD